MSERIKVYIKGGQGIPGEASVNLGEIIHASTPKTTIVSGDEIPISDSQDSWSLKKTTIGSLVTFLQGIFPSIGALAGYVPIARTVNGKALNANISITKGDVGLASVDNTSDALKPISIAAQTALDSKVDNTELSDFPRFSASSNFYENGVGYGSTATFGFHANAAASLKNAIDLSNVNNTSDLAKPISTATQTALDGKASLASGTPNTWTANNVFNGGSVFNLVVYANSGISATGESNFQGDVTYEGEQSYADGTTFNYGGGSSVRNNHRVALQIDQVNNTSDLGKPISTLTQAALNGKGNLLTNNVWNGTNSFTQVFASSIQTGNEFGGPFEISTYYAPIRFECEFSYSQTSRDNHRAALGISSSEIRLISTTTTNTPTDLSTNGSSPVSGNQIPLSNNQAMTIQGIAIARSSTGEVKSWNISATVIRGANAASTTVNFMAVNSNFESPTASTWDLELQANTTLGTLKVVATGQTGKTINWNCFLYFSKL